MAGSKIDAWKKEDVIRRLREDKKAGNVTAQIFLSDDVPDEDFQRVARELVGKSQGESAKIGKTHPLAKSFSVTAPFDIIAEIAASPSVKSILPSEISDVYPKPVRVKKR